MNPSAGMFILIVVGIIAVLAWCLSESGKTNADWKGKLEHRFVLTRLRREWGRWCYRTDCCGETKACWWEQDTTAKDD
jgi:hypothetical protein